jgi:proline iminopeptidase
MRVDIGDVELWVEDDQGSGPPVLVPTGGGITFYRNTFSPRLARELRLIYVENRGTGGSSGSLEGSTFASLADDLDAARKALGLGKVAVMGQSNHGCIAMEYGLRHPDATAAVVSVASVAAMPGGFAAGLALWEQEADDTRKAALAERQAAFAALDKTGMTVDEVAVRSYVSVAPLGWRDLSTDVWALWGRAGVNGAASLFEWMPAALAAFDVRPRFPEYRVPVLVVSGRYDYLCLPGPWDESIGALPGARFELFERSAHNPQYEEQDRFDDLVIGFVKEHVAN